MKTRLSLLAVTAMVGTSTAAVVENGWVQNRISNWSHLPGAAASQSSDASGGVASRGIDGNYNGQWSGGSVTHTAPNTGDPTAQFWQVDLGVARSITDITLFNRLDCCGGRLSNYSVLAGNDASFATTLYSSGNQATAPAGDSINFSSVGTVARYVRIQRDGLSTTDEAVISLAEVDVLGAALFSYANLATGSSASQSSTLVNTASPTADKAVDGNLNNVFNAGSTTHTAQGSGGDVWWETSLASISDINEIALYNRGDCCQDRLSNFRVSIYNGAIEVWGQNYFEDSGQAGDIFAIQEDTGGTIASGDRVRIELIGGVNNGATGTDVLSLSEVEIFGTAIPEPSGVILLGLGSLAMMRRRRR